MYKEQNTAKEAMENKKVVIEFCINTGPANIVDLHPEKAVCPAPVVWMLEFW